MIEGLDASADRISCSYTVAYGCRGMHARDRVDMYQYVVLICRITTLICRIEDIDIVLVASMCQSILMRQVARDHFDLLMTNLHGKKKHKLIGIIHLAKHTSYTRRASSQGTSEVDVQACRHTCGLADTLTHDFAATLMYELTDTERGIRTLCESRPLPSNELIPIPNPALSATRFHTATPPSSETSMHLLTYKTDLQCTPSPAFSAAKCHTTRENQHYLC